MEPVEAAYRSEARGSHAAVWFDRVGLVAVVALGVALRFIARSPLWLDEALTVDIARLPLGRIGPWLRHDGHPPLYYWLLHWWIGWFGSGDAAVRALAGVFGVALLPLVWVAARRLGGRLAAWVALVLLAVCPFAVRYSTETRMYALVMVLALAAWLVGNDALRRPVWWRLVAIALLSAALLWSHYWAMWYLGGIAVLLLARAVAAHRGGDSVRRDATVKVLVAMAAGGLLFLPWIPSLLFQSAHTGTPWGKPALPTEVTAVSVADIGGGSKGDNLVLGWSLLILALLGLFGRAAGARHIELDVRSRPRERPAALVIVATLLLAMVAMWATHGAFQSRYNAVWFPLFVLLAAVGVTRFSGSAVRRGVLVFVLLLGVAGSLRTSFTRTRSEARKAAHAIVAAGRPGDLVVTCPDQLGPSLARELPAGFRIGTYPKLASPLLIDWVDYKKRVDAASPARFADMVMERAGDHRIFLAWAGTYATHKGVCEKVLNALAARRPGMRSLVSDDGGYYEHEAVMIYPPPAK